ncbi:SDR family NAD(P)-dependent oxidoreductase [Sulfidibacter corallicola]|uniref:SDR family NAD(P)-dependent oxidoreductase n=1 Tax=Sulfidibacter corallicola TaxID=2818388 RepID=A0A8A4TV66_SULCO|nr:SDR family NAD(P)-dependent oxidoreductase [Sulfidibacter corallicola]QTD53420.1 SDR family NAD(P)-dependent oxidoreductase [Sulfidibacter corallicola]
MNHLLELIYRKVAEHKLTKTEALGLIEGMRGTASARLHPLIHRNTSDFSGQRFSATFTGHEFFLRDHVVKGQKVMPAVAFLEMARAALACSAGFPEPSRASAIRLRHTVWIRPLIVDQAPKDIHIRLDVEQERIHFQIYAEPEQAGDEPVVYCQGVGSVGESGDPVFPDLQALRTDINHVALNADQCYEAFSKVGIEYGPGQRGIETVYTSDNQVLAKLTLPHSVSSQNDFLLHPSTMDAALQAVIAMNMGATGTHAKPSLPFSLDEFAAIGGCTPAMWAWIRHAKPCKCKECTPQRDVSQTRRGDVKLDIDVFNDQGEVCARFKGLSSRVLEARREAPPTEGLTLLEPVWSPISLQREPIVDQRVLILGGTQTQIAAVRSMYPDAGHFALGTENISAIAARLKGPIDHLVWIAPDRQVSTVTEESVVEAQEIGVLQVFRIIKALFTLNYGVKELTWTLITTQSVAVADTDHLNPTHSGIHGLAGSLAKEYPHWRIRLLDMEADRAWPVEAMFRVSPNDQGDAVARRGEQWYAQQLLPVDDKPASQSPYRTRGVYVVIGGAGGIGAVWSRSVVGLYDARVIWIGRRAESDLGPAQREALSHPNLTYIRADATDKASLQQARDQIKAKHGRIHGVIHSALVLQDRSLAKMEEGPFRRSLAAKVDISVRLAQVFCAEPLDFLVFFSSMNAFAKAAGQSNYAAGCTFKDAFAHRLARECATTVKIMNWGFWGSVGVAADAAHNQRMASVGVGSIEPDEGMATLEKLLQSPLPQMAVFKAVAPRVEEAPEAPQHIESGPSLVEKSRAYFRSFIAEALKIPPNRIDPSKPLENYGLDSILAVQLTNGLSKHFDNLSSTLFFEVPTIDALVEEMMRTQKEALIRRVGFEASTPQPEQVKQSPPAPKTFKRPQRRATATQAPRTTSKDVAIIGLTGRFPQADDLETFWDNLVHGKDCIEEIPKDRWDAAAYNQDEQEPGTSYSKWGGFLSDVDGFDPLFFNISPREAQVMDPKERLFLETVWNLLEGRGYTRQILADRYAKRVGVYVGAMYQQYHAFDADLVTESVVSLSSYGSIANRVSHFFDFQGPSIAIDTMCSSSLTAVKMAYESLLNGECKLAIAGGVNLSIHPKKYIGLSASGMIGSHPQSRSFSDGDGYLPAEAVGAVLLKPLAQAVEDGDAILAVIKSVTANHGGAGTGYSIPNPQAQIQLMRDNFEKAGIDPRTISYLESAVNGSPLGDPIEINALNRFFGEATSDRGFCAIGAVKANIGHAEAASGISQLAKVVLQLQHRQFAPSLDETPRNPKIRLDDSPFYLPPREATAWEQPVLEIDGQMRAIPRRVAISSFGAAGANAHLIVEEYAQPVPENEPGAQGQAHVIPLSANAEDRLPVMCANLLDAIRSDPKPIADIAYTLQLHREAMAYRLAFVVEDMEELVLGLEQVVAQVDHQVPMFRGNTEDFSNNLLSGETGKAVLQSIMAEPNLAKAADFWTHGGHIPWTAFHEGENRRPVALPTYPFAKRRYWIPAVGATSVDEPQQGRATKDWSDWLRRTAGDLLQIDDMPTRKSLDTLGFGSLDGVQLKSAFEREFGVTAPIALFQGAQTIEQITLALEKVAPFEQTFTPSAVADSEILPVIVPNPSERYQPFPLSDIQESYLIGRKLGDKEDAVGCHIYLELEATQPLDLFRLNAAWKRLVQDHDMLRTVILPDGRQQVLEDTPPYEFKVLDLRRKTAEERSASLQKLRNDLSHKVYETDQWPLFDIRISICPQRKTVVHFSIDELLLDWSGIDMLFAQWQAYYREPATQRRQPQVTFRDYMVAVKKFEASQRYQQDLEYWLTKLDGMPGAPQFPRQEPSESRNHRRAKLEASLDQAQWRALKEKAQALKVSPTTLLLCVFTEVLRIWNDGNPFSLIMTYFNRLALHPDLNQVLGPFISTNLFRVDDPGDRDLADIFRDTQTSLWEDLDHGNVSGIRVLRELKKRKKIPNDLSLPVVFTSLLGQEREPQNVGFFADLAYSVTQTPQVYLDHQVHERDGALHFNWDVVKGTFAPGVMDALFSDYCAVLQRLAAHPEQCHDGSWRSAVKQTTAKVPIHLLKAQPDRAFEPFPQTDQQQAYAYGRSKYAGNISSQVYMDFEAEDLDVARLENAWRKVMETHDMLRVVVQADGTQQVLKDPRPYAIRVEDFRGEKPAEVLRQCAAVRHAMMANITPLGAWPYFDIAVSRLDESKCRVHFSIDMIIADGTSINMLAEALFHHYEHPDAPIKKPSISFRDYVMYLQHYRNTEGFRKSTHYWRDKFADIPPGPDLPAFEGVSIKGTERFEGVLEDWFSIKRKAEGLQVSPGMVLLAVYAEVLAAWSDRKPFSLVVPCWKRLALHPELDEVVGDFTAMSWVTADLEAKPFEEKVRGYHEALERDLSHQAVSGLSVLRRVAMKHRNKSLGFPVVFTNLAKPTRLQLPPGLTFGEFLSQTSQVHIDCISLEEGGQLNLHWDVAKGLYPPGMIAEMFRGYQRVLDALTDAGNWRKTNFDAFIGARPSEVGVAVANAMEKVL